MRAFAWDRLRDAHKSRGFLLVQSVPDTPWATPVPAPPQHPHELPMRQVMAMFGPTACHSPDEIHEPLTRAEAAGWIVDYLGWAGSDACRTVVSATASATR